MKRMGYVFLAEAVLAGMLVTLAGGQTESLGDYARSVRKDEKPASAKKYDNDNLPNIRQDQRCGKCHGIVSGRR